MFHSETTLSRIKDLLSDTLSNTFLEKYGLNNMILPPHVPQLRNEIGLKLVEMKLDIAVKKSLQLLPDSLIDLFEHEELLDLISDELKQYLTLNLWAAGISESVNEGDILPYVQNLMNGVSDKEASEALTLDEEEKINIRNTGDSAMNLPRHDNPILATSLYMSKRKDMPNYSLPFNAFISVYNSIHNDLNHIKGKRSMIEAYKAYKFNHTPQRTLYNRFHNYFDSILHNLPNRETKINKVLFEREYNLVLASQINNATKDLSGSFREWSRRVLSLAALLPTVEGRLVLIEQYTSHQLLILEGNGFGTPQISPNRDTRNNAMLKLAADILSMALIALPVMEMIFVSELKLGEEKYLEELSDVEPIYLKMDDVQNIDETLIVINHVQAIHTKNKLWDVQMLFNKYLDKNLHDDNVTERHLDQFSNSTLILSEKIECLAKCIRDEYFGDFLKFDK